MNIPISKLVTPPSEAPVSVTDAKNFMRVDDTFNDALIAVLIDAATDAAEQYMDRKIVSQVWDIFFDNFPFTMADDWWDGVREVPLSYLRKPVNKMSLLFGPLISLTGVYYYDEDDVSMDGVLYDPSNFSVDLVGPCPSIVLKIGSVWPQDVLKPVNGVRVRGTYGFGAASACPKSIKLAIMMAVSKYFENRGDTAADDFSSNTVIAIPPSALNLLNPYRRNKLG